MMASLSLPVLLQTRITKSRQTPFGQKLNYACLRTKSGLPGAQPWQRVCKVDAYTGLHTNNTLAAMADFMAIHPQGKSQSTLISL